MAIAGRDDWATTTYTAPIGDEPGDILRVHLRIERGRVTRFTARYEAWIEGRAYPVVRYDSVHNRPHRDLLDRSGRVVEKRWAPLGTSLAEALTEFIIEIRTNWRTYRDRFLRRGE